MKRHIAISLILIGLPVAHALADTPIDESRPANPDILVRIDNVAGSIDVRPGSDDSVDITGTLGSGSKPLSVEGDRSRLTIRVEAENGGGWGGNRMQSSDLVVRVPAQARLEINAVSADVTVAGVRGSDAEVESVSGDVAFRADSQRVYLKTVSGGIDAEGAGSNWTVGTVSGHIRLPKAGGELRVESVSGGIELDFGRAERARMETVSGRIEARGTLASGGSLAAQSVSGSIDLVLAGEVDARISAKTFSGPIDSDFGEPERAGMGGGKRLETRVGGGSADISLESFSGRIAVRRAN